MRKKNIFPEPNDERFSFLSFPQCVHLVEKCQCSILNVRVCNGEKCTFLQTDADYINSQKRWKQHLNSMSVEKQEKISREYYGGKKLW